MFIIRKFFDEGDGLTGGEESVTMTDVAEQSTEDNAEDEQTTYSSEGADADSHEDESEEADPASQQSAEENAKYAAMRRKAEAEAEKKYASKQAELDRQFASMFGQYTNPETGEPIRTAQDYFNAMQAQQNQQTRSQLEQAGIDPNLIDQAVRNNPAVQYANAVIEQQQAEQAQSMVAEDIEAIRSIDPTIKSENDVAMLDTYPQMLAMIQNSGGRIRLSEAYKLVNFDRLVANQRQAGQQSAINQARSKGHLNAAAGVSGSVDGEDIPTGELSQWKAWFPDKSSKELRALYNKSRKRS